MITVTSAEKNRIEGQMKTALPFWNTQVDYMISIEEGKKGRSKMTFNKDGVLYQLPIFYVTPSTDDSIWEMLAEHIEQEKDNHGIVVIKFNSEQHTIQNAETCVLTNRELYDQKALSELCRLCSYFDFSPYKTQVFDSKEMDRVFRMLNTNTTQDDIETAEVVEKVKFTEAPKKVVKETVKPAPVSETKKVEKSKEDEDLENDIRALINDCFGIF